MLDDAFAILGPNPRQPDALTPFSHPSAVRLPVGPSTWHLTIYCTRLHPVAASDAVRPVDFPHFDRPVTAHLIMGVLVVCLLTAIPVTRIHLITNGNFAPSIYHQVGGVLVPTDMTDEIDAHTSGPFVMKIAVQTQGAKMPFQLPAEKRRGLSAAGVAGLLGAEEDKVFVGTGACCKG